MLDSHNIPPAVNREVDTVKGVAIIRVREELGSVGQGGGNRLSEDSVIKFYNLQI